MVKHSHLDLPGAMLVTSGLITLVFALSQAPIWGWLSISTVSTMVVGVILLTAFIFNESKSSHPLMPLTIFKIRNLTGANLMIAPIYAGMMGTFFISSLYMQQLLHYSPVITGLSFLPFPIALTFTSILIPKLVSKYGYKPFLILGPFLIAISLFLLSRVPVHGTYLICLLPSF